MNVILCTEECVTEKPYTAEVNRVLSDLEGLIATEDMGELCKLRDIILLRIEIVYKERLKELV